MIKALMIAVAILLVHLPHSRTSLKFRTRQSDISRINPNTSAVSVIILNDKCLQGMPVVIVSERCVGAVSDAAKQSALKFKIFQVGKIDKRASNREVQCSLGVWRYYANQAMLVSLTLLQHDRFKCAFQFFFPKRVNPNFYSLGRCLSSVDYSKDDYRAEMSGAKTGTVWSSINFDMLKLNDVNGNPRALVDLNGLSRGDVGILRGINRPESSFGGFFGLLEHSFSVIRSATGLVQGSNNRPQRESGKKSGCKRGVEHQLSPMSHAFLGLKLALVGFAL